MAWIEMGVEKFEYVIIFVVNILNNDFPGFGLDCCLTVKTLLLEES